MAKINYGDIFEIDTSRGKAYLHYIYRGSDRIELIRVLRGLYPDSLPDLEQLANTTEAFMVFFPLAAAARRKIVRRIDSFSAHGFSKPKYMRTTHNIRGEFLGWFIVDTDTLKLELVKLLSPDQVQLSPWGVWNDTLLIERLENGWTLENWR